MKSYAPAAKTARPASPERKPTATVPLVTVTYATMLDTRNFLAGDASPPAAASTTTRDFGADDALLVNFPTGMVREAGMKADAEVRRKTVAKTAVNFMFDFDLICRIWMVGHQQKEERKRAKRC